MINQLLWLMILFITDLIHTQIWVWTYRRNWSQSTACKKVSFCNTQTVAMSHDRKDNVNPLFPPIFLRFWTFIAIKMYCVKWNTFIYKFLELLLQPAITDLSDIFVKQNMRVIQNFYASPIICM